MTSPAALLAAHNLSPKKQYGQNFLKDPSTARMIIDRIGLSADDVVLEIGAGLGALTLPAAGSDSAWFSPKRMFIQMPGF